MFSIQRKKDVRVVHAYTHNLADLPNGIGLAVSDLVPGVALLEGTPIGIDSATGLAHVIKCATITENADNAATAYKVKKGSHFKVGDIIALGAAKKGVAITAIDRDSNATYDTITVGATLAAAVVVGQVLVQAKAAASSSALAYTPVALTADSYDVVANENLFVAAITIGQFKESCIPGIATDVKNALKGIVFI